MYFSHQMNTFPHQALRRYNICFVEYKVFLCCQMWKAAAGQSVSVSVDDGGDDWETDPDFEVTDTKHLQSCFNSGVFKVGSGEKSREKL